MESLDPYKDDVIFLNEIKDHVFNETSIGTYDCDSSLFNGKYEELSDGREVRIVFPHGTEPLKLLLQNSSGLYFVGFIGFMRTEISETIRKAIWDTDLTLVKELQNHPDVVGYFTAQRKDCINWGNLVFLRSRTVIEKWRDSEKHMYAVTDLSPRYYSNVRIHSGELKPDKEMVIKKTIFLNYMLSTQGRKEVFWTV